jgi:hypothetical protein
LKLGCDRRLVSLWLAQVHPIRLLQISIRGPEFALAEGGF